MRAGVRLPVSHRSIEGLGLAFEKTKPFERVVLIPLAVPHSTVAIQGPMLPLTIPYLIDPLIASLFTLWNPDGS